MRRNARTVVLTALAVTLALPLIAQRARRVRSRARVLHHDVLLHNECARLLDAAHAVQPKTTLLNTVHAAPHSAPLHRFVSPRRLVLAVTLTAVITASTLIGGTSAFLSDSVTTSTLSVQGVNVSPPTGLTLSSGGPSAINVGWTAPVSGFPPTQYEVFRRTAGGSYGGTPNATINAPTISWSDTGVAACTTYYYKVRSTASVFASAFTAEASHTHSDAAAPSVTASAIVATSGRSSASHIANFVKPGGAFYAYATVSDTCAPSDAVTVTVTLTALGVTGAQTATFGSFTPVGGGPTYNFRAGPFTAGAELADGATPAWSLSAADPNGNSATPAGSAVTVDAVGPTASATPVVVSASTNFFWAFAGTGEVRQASTAYAYASLTDARSGVAPENDGVTANVSTIATGQSAVAVPAGSFTTDNGSAWGRRSASITTDSSLTEGSKAVSFTLYDRVGNTTTANTTVTVDNTALGFSSCAATNNNATLGAATSDTSSFTFNDALDPGSISAAWTGAATTPITATIINGAGTNDYMTYTLPIMAAGAPASGGFDLAAANWVNANRSWTTSTLGLITSGTTLQVTMNGGTNTTRRATSGTARFATTLTDVAGNAYPGGASACSTAW